MGSGWSVLVNFPDGTREVVLVLDGPVVGSDIASGDGNPWTVTESSIREDEIDGRQIHFEVSVEPGKPPEPAVELR
jgi:hypothetical protein